MSEGNTCIAEPNSMPCCSCSVLHGVNCNSEKKTFNFVSHIVTISREFDWRKDAHATELKQRPQIFRKLSFIELCDSKLSGLHPFEKMAINHWVKIGRKQKNRIVMLTENSSIITNDTQGPQKPQHHQQ